jgi:transcriptional regulator with GAF, ATPase, and Fis domain
MHHKTVKKKRWQLVLISLLILLSSSGTVIVFGIISHENTLSLIALGTLVVLFSAYMIESEYRLEKLEDQLFQEQFRTLEEQAKQSALSSRLKELMVLHKGMEAVSREKTPEKALDKMLRALMELFEADRGSIMLMDEANQNLFIAASAGIPPEFVAKSRVKLGEGIAGLVAKTGEPLLIPGRARSDQYTNFQAKAADLQSSICAPLRMQDRIIGVLNFSIVKKTGRNFTENDLRMLLVFTQYAALTIELAQLQVTARKMGSVPH